MEHLTWPPHNGRTTTSTNCMDGEALRARSTAPIITLAKAPIDATIHPQRHLIQSHHCMDVMNG